MSLTARSRSIAGTLRQEIVIDGKHRLITDEPEAVGGEGSAPSPHELLPAALAACVSTTLVMYARQKSWNLAQVTVEIDYERDSTLLDLINGGGTCGNVRRGFGAITSAGTALTSWNACVAASARSSSSPITNPR